MQHLHRKEWAEQGTDLLIILNGVCSLLLALVDVSGPSSLHGVPGLYCFNTDAKLSLFLFPRDLPCRSDSEESACNAGDLGWEDLLEEEMATHYSLLVWRIPWTEEPGSLQSMRSQRVRHD